MGARRYGRTAIWVHGGVGARRYVRAALQLHDGFPAFTARRRLRLDVVWLLCASDLYKSYYSIIIFRIVSIFALFAGFLPYRRRRLRVIPVFCWVLCPLVLYNSYFSCKIYQIVSFCLLPPPHPARGMRFAASGSTPRPVPARAQHAHAAAAHRLAALAAQARAQHAHAAAAHCLATLAAQARARIVRRRQHAPPARCGRRVLPGRRNASDD